jgi:pyruvate dehydrogenase phosphatase
MTSLHTCDNHLELRRLLQSHPGEERTIAQAHPVAGGLRLLGGLIPTRAFGDGMYKWPLSWQRGMFRALGISLDLIPQTCRTPPYLHASPEIRSHKIDSRDLALVVASDGLFDELEDSDLARLIHLYHKEPKSNNNADDSDLKPPPPAAFQLHYVNTITSIQELGLSAPPTKESESMDEPGEPHSHQRHWIRKDENLATHLVRNAMGGKVQSRVRTLLSLPWPDSRDYRDDVTCIVLPFPSLHGNLEERTFPIVPTLPKEVTLADPHKDLLVSSRRKLG